MSSSQLYIFLIILALVLLFFLVFPFKKNKEQKKLTPLAGLAFGFVLAGIVFGEEWIIGYGLISIGILLAFIDIFRKFKTGRSE